ncbi:alpha/beta fold hydrolase [Streptosporangium sp. NPDC023615]|uniref:thioesterase II family protein n=1 Tax=Streptosporangium sp. NPDC023615 TaxID=3154794 RepID=UPI003444D379
MKETVVVRRRHNPEAAVRLVCLPFCGGGAASHLQWDGVVPPDVELAVICYPGREGRFAEDYATHWSELIDDTVDAVLSASDMPYLLFGHSMGGWIAFDVAARIESLDARPPAGVVVSSVNAPSRGLTERDMYPNQRDTDDELIGWISRHGQAADHVLSDPDLRELAVELMRADLTVRDTFFHTPGTRIRAPLQLLTGEHDDVVVPEVGEQWGELTTGAYRHDRLPGEHFFTPEVWRNLPRYIGLWP